MPRIDIDTVDDPRIDVFLGLRDHEARKLREQPGGDMAGSFIAEGDLVIERALRAGQHLRSVLVAADRTAPLPATVTPDVPIYSAAGPVLREITGRPELRDPIACFVRPEPDDAAALLRSHSSFAVLEAINNPNNLGVIMRNAAGLGVGAVLLDPTCGDPLYRRAIRASMGQVFAITHARITSLPGALDEMHDSEVVTVALTPRAKRTISEISRQLTAASKVAVLLGAEGHGLTDETIDAATHRARIPMHNDVDSLNVASAAAIAFDQLVTSGGV